MILYVKLMCIDTVFHHSVVLATIDFSFVILRCIFKGSVDPSTQVTLTVLKFTTQGHSFRSVITFF